MSDEKKTCPNCGYCPTCGRANAQPWGVYPNLYPYQYPYVPWFEPIPQIGWPPPTITYTTSTSGMTTEAETVTVADINTYGGN